MLSRPVLLAVQNCEMRATRQLAVISQDILHELLSIYTDFAIICPYVKTWIGLLVPVAGRFIRITNP